MDQSFFFYDLETTGFNPKEARIMQFAGQRTTLNLEKIGKPQNIFIQLTKDILPDPAAILLTGITPEFTLKNGITEAEFLKHFYQEIALPGTIFAGYNSIRFDDEFIRFINYRNYYDPYEWHWKDSRSRWDLLDCVRMTRALRPEGIIWPKDDLDRPTNKLGLLAKANNLIHDNAHDALSDVEATLALAHLLLEKQPKLFNYLLAMREKKNVAKIVYSGQPFVYTSGKYSSNFNHTTVVQPLIDHPQPNGVLVYDLREDPEIFSKYTPKQIADSWVRNSDSNLPMIPIKTLQLHRCPAVAPISVMEGKNWQQLGLSSDLINKNLQTLNKMPDFSKKVLLALDILNKQRDLKYKMTKPLSVDSQLYDGFFDNHDRAEMPLIRQTPANKIITIKADFHDGRLDELLPLYIARNYPDNLNDSLRAKWLEHCSTTLLLGGQKSRLSIYNNELRELVKGKMLDAKQKSVVKELQNWAQTIQSSDFGSR
jgi:exodeoxyribonuclease-1